MKTIAFTICTVNKRLAVHYMERASCGEANGYVAVPPEHPYHGKDVYDIGCIDVHGGITLSDYLNVKEYPVEDVEFISEAKEVPSNWWIFGFDTMHFGYNKVNWSK